MISAMGIIDEYRELSSDLKSTFYISEQMNFVKRNALEEIPASKRYKNFVEIMWFLANNGPSAIQDIVSKYTKSSKTEYKAKMISRMINGNTEKNSDGLVARGLLERTTAKKREGTYGLTTMGVLFGIELFFDVGIHQRYVKEYLKGRADHRNQPKTIMDVLAAKYPDKLPYVFDKMEKLRKHKDIDIFVLYNIIKHGRDVSSPEVIDHGVGPYFEEDMQVPTMFFWAHMQPHSTINGHKISARIDAATDNFVAKLYRDSIELQKLVLYTTQKSLAELDGDHTKTAAYQKKILLQIENIGPRTLKWFKEDDEGNQIYDNTTYTVEQLKQFATLV